MSQPQDPLQSSLAPFHPALNPGQLALIRKYLDLLKLWNRRISLVSYGDIACLADRHVGESLFAASAVPIRHGRLADLGTGAGFPGIPLKIASPDLQITLIESNQRKCAFLSEAARALQFEHCEIVCSRYEDFAPAVGFDFITCRAVGQYDQILKWARTSVSPGGMVILWLGIDDAASLSKLKEWIWKEPIAIPNSDRRVLLIGCPRP